MLKDRLSLALESGLIGVPKVGTIAVFEPRLEDDLLDLPTDRVRIVARRFPVHQAFETMGYSCGVALEEQASLSVVALPRGRAAAQALVAQAAAQTDGPIVIDGQKTDGIASMLKAVRARTDVGEVLSKAHGKLFVAEGGDFSGWSAKDTLVDGFLTRPGVFSADGIDPGSALLAEALPESLKGHVVDLGAGWGFLSHAILSRKGVTQLDLVEADHVAVKCAQHNINDPRAQYHWSDATQLTLPAPVDHVVTNPPFHTGRSADPSLGRAFLRRAATLLKPKGTLWLVANRHLPYESTLQECFAQVETLEQSAAYKLYAATRPRKSPTKG